MIAANITHATCNHNGFVITPDLIIEVHFKAAEVTTDIGPTKFVVERGAADRALNHNLQSTGDPIGFAIVSFPGLQLPWNFQV